LTVSGESKSQMTTSASTRCSRCGSFHAHRSSTAATMTAWLRRRDGMLCWLCYEPMDFSAKLCSAAAPSIDHVLERENGGCRHPNDLRLAHYFCNSTRKHGDPRYHRGYVKVLRQLQETANRDRRKCLRHGSPEECPQACVAPAPLAEEGRRT